MIIEKHGVISPPTFGELRGGEAFFVIGAPKEVLLMKGYQFQGIGHCAINLANGAISVPNQDLPVSRSNAKVVV